MNETSALLANLVQTKSIQKVLAPIAAQVSQLILLNEAYDRGDKNAFPEDFAPGASNIMQATGRLVAAAQEHAANTDDEIIKSQMPGACELLTVAGQSTVTASQRIGIEGLTEAARKNLIRSAKDVLEGTLKVFVVTDDAEVRKIVKSVHCVEDRLSVITAVKSMKHLVVAFKALTEAVMILAALVDRRQLELSHPQQRERLIIAMTTLKKTMPMLSTSMQTYCKYPNNEQAMSGRNYAIGQAMDSLTEVVAAVENKDNSYLDDYAELEEPGMFITTIDTILELLGEESTTTVADLPAELDIQVESAVRHCMAVAHIASQHHRDLLVRNAQRVLHQRTTVTDMAKNVMGNQDFYELREDFGTACEVLMLESQDLERHVNGAVLQLIVSVFKETVEPMDRLVRAALKPIVDEEILEEIESQAMLQPFIDAFHNHSDLMCQVARFAAASSSDARKVRVIHGCVISLESLDPELVPATVACRRDITDRAGLEHLRLLRKEWSDNVRALVDVIDELTDARLFISVSEEEIRQSVALCRQSMYSQAAEIADAARLLIGQSNRVAQTAVRLINKNEDPIFRNGVMAYIKQLKKVIPAVKASANKVVNYPGNLQTHEKFHKRCEMASKCIAKIQSAFSGETELELLNPLRQRAREKIDEDACANLDFEISDPEPAASALQVPYKAADSMAKLKKKAAFKNFGVDLVDGELKIVSESVVTAAVAGNSQKLDVAYNVLLSRANHVIEVATGVAHHNSEHQSSLRESSRTITDLTPELMSKAREVVKLNTQEVEPLHQICDQWASLMTYVQNLVDGIIEKWKAVSDKVIASAKMKSSQLIMTQNQHLIAVSKHLQIMAESALDKLNNCSDIAMFESSCALKDLKDDVENQTTMITTLADIFAHSGSSEDGSQLDAAGREWACKAYCISAAIEKLSVMATAKVIDEDVAGCQWENASQTRDILRQRTEDTVRLKGLLISVIQSSTNPAKTREVHLTMAQIDTVTADMHEVCNLYEDGSAFVSQSLDKLLTPHRMNIFQWNWAVKMEELRNHLEHFTQDFVSFLETTIVENDYDNLKIHVASVKSRIERMIKQSNIDPKQAAALTVLMEELNSWTRKVIELPDEAPGLRSIQQQWTTTALQLELLLTRLKIPNASDAMKLLKLDADKRKQAPAFIKHIQEKPESTGDLLADIRRAGGSVAVASTMVVKENAKSPSGMAPSPKVLSGTNEYQRLRSLPPVQHQRPQPPSVKMAYKPKSRSDLSFNRSVTFLNDVDQWEDDNNEIVKVAKEMSNKLNDMAEFARNQGLQPTGSIKSKEHMIAAAKLIASQGEKLVKFARILAKYCRDKSFAKDLLFYADHVPTVSTQLSILSSVKAATPEDRTADKMLVKNSENLLDAISKMLSAAEATSVKGFETPPADAVDDKEAVILATRWNRKMMHFRWRENSLAETDELGLRRVNRLSPRPTLRPVMPKT